MNRDFFDQLLHSIIDDIHPLFTPISDEDCIKNNSVCGTYQRCFHNRTNSYKYKITWKVYYGTPETVKTVFEPITKL